ncbi:MAG TPA: cytochrome D1 domain-containing protein, partial [Pyrinomonadaceae bacterium]|nr:cytochrome D1 domain-containing protein [Pyrinomonadaceae bacterium]
MPRIILSSIVTLLFILPANAGVLVIAYMAESQVALVDSETMQTIVRFASGRNPHEVRISPDGRRAYVAAGPTVTVVDLRNRRVKAHFDLGEYSAHDIRISRDGKRFWAACARSQTILEVDAETGKTIKAYKTAADGSWFVEITHDEKKLYTPNLEGKSVSVIDRANGAVKVIKFESAVYGIDITPDGKQVWVTGKDVTVIDTATDTVVTTVKTPEADTGRIRIAADGKTAAVALSKRLVTIDIPARKIIREIDLAASPKVLTLS